jgi:hypothetical protein
MTTATLTLGTTATCQHCLRPIAWQEHEGRVGWTDDTRVSRQVCFRALRLTHVPREGTTEVPPELPVEIDGGGWRIHETATHYVDVLPMIYTDRIACTPVDDETIYDRFWCYPKGGAALFAAVVWDGADDTEPVGWLKAYDGRRHGGVTADA